MKLSREVIDGFKRRVIANRAYYAAKPKRDDVIEFCDYMEENFFGAGGAQLGWFGGDYITIIEGEEERLEPL